MNTRTEREVDRRLSWPLLVFGIAATLLGIVLRAPWLIGGGAGVVLVALYCLVILSGDGR